MLALIGETIDDADEVCGCRVVDKSTKKGTRVWQMTCSETISCRQSYPFAPILCAESLTSWLCSTSGQSPFDLDSNLFFIFSFCLIYFRSEQSYVQAWTVAQVMYGRSGRQVEDQTAGCSYGQRGIQAKQQNEVTRIWLQEKEYKVRSLSPLPSARMDPGPWTLDPMVPHSARNVFPYFIHQLVLILIWLSIRKK